jgi:uncharacterized membrane protein (DUF2068 family)
VPTLVKIISILNYIGAGFMIIFALICFLGGSMAATFLAEMNDPNITAMTGAMLIVFGVLCLIGAAIDILVGWGLWKAKNWARILTIVLCLLNVVFGLIMIIGAPPLGILVVIINGLIAGYLLFSKNVKAAFA